MMSSCCTLRLKRRRAFSRDSLSWIMTSATIHSPPIRFGLVSCGATAAFEHRPVSLSHACRCATTRPARGLPLRVAMERNANTCSKNHILSCAPFGRSGVTLMRLMASSNQLRARKSRNLYKARWGAWVVRHKYPCSYGCILSVYVSPIRMRVTSSHFLLSVRFACTSRNFSC